MHTADSANELNSCGLSEPMFTCNDAKMSKWQQSKILTRQNSNQIVDIQNTKILFRKINVKK